jgi:hypothetical protein
MTKTFSCVICNYHTNIKCNYTKHLQTIKHHKNTKIPQNPSQIPQNPSPIPQNPPPLTKSKFSCIYCNYKTNRKDNFNRHLLSCENKIKCDEDKDIVIKKLIKENTDLKHEQHIINEQSEQITTLTNTINELKTLNKVEILSTENKLLKEQSKNITNTAIICNNTNNIQNITNYIKNTFSNAPNVKTIDHIENIEKYIGSNSTDSYTSLIHDYYLTGIEPKDRSVWLVDSARDKYLTRLNDRWQIDINGEEFCKLVNKALSKALFQGKDKMPDNKDKMSLVLLELLLYVSEQTKMPKKQKSQFLIQNIQDWKELGNKFTEKE